MSWRMLGGCGGLVERSQRLSCIGKVTQGYDYINVKTKADKDSVKIPIAKEMLRENAELGSGVGAIVCGFKVPVAVARSSTAANVVFLVVAALVVVEAIVVVLLVVAGVVVADLVADFATVLDVAGPAGDSPSRKRDCPRHGSSSTETTCHPLALAITMLCSNTFSTVSLWISWASKSTFFERGFMTSGAVEKSMAFARRSREIWASRRQSNESRFQIKTVRPSVSTMERTRRSISPNGGRKYLRNRNSVSEAFQRA
jgi:hypothetical protein